MKAAICREFGAPLTIEDVNLRAPKEGEVHVELAACAICHSDILFLDGAWGGPLPALYGHEAAGIVKSVGTGVSRAKVGDRVLVTLIRSCGECHGCDSGHPTDCENAGQSPKNSPITDATGAPIWQAMATGGFAQEVCVDQSQIVTLPADIDLDVASLLACGAITGIGAVTNSAKMEEGADVVVIGAGGVGLNTVQGALIKGAKTVIAIDLDQEKLDGAKDFGAHHALLASQEDVVDQVRALTSGRGAQYVFVTVGAIPAYRQAIEFLAPRGEVIMVGMPASGDFLEFEPVNLAALSQALRGTKMGDTVLDRDIPQLLEWYKSGDLKLDELISNRYSLDQINEAISETKSGKSRRNVIIF